MKTQILTFQAPKTAGCTTIVSNLALLDQLTHPDQKIGLLQLTTYPDIHHHFGLSPVHSIAHLERFWGSDEWTPELITRIRQDRGISIISSPSLKDWGSITPKLFDEIFHLVTFPFDRLYIDLHHSVPEFVLRHVYKKTGHHVAVLSSEPASDQALEVHFKAFPELEAKTKYLFNQTSPTLSGKNVPPSLPSDPGSVWHQIFEGHPVALQKRSRLRKALIKFLSFLINSRS